MSCTRPQSHSRLRVSRSLNCATLLVALLALTSTLAPRARASAPPRTARIVLLKVDGLPYRFVERYARQRDARTGKSELPWIEHVFFERGTRLQNFYTRGMSLSGPSWSLLETGQHLQIKGNVEFDRYTLHAYDYLNFIPFWVANVGRERVDMPGAELLDEVGTPLLIDAYPYAERHTSFQLYQRGLRWTTLQRGLMNRVTTRSPRELFDEWNTGIEARAILMEQLERELLEKLNDPQKRYLDLYTTDFDHAAHHNRDEATRLKALKELDALVGRIWTAIQKTPLASETALVLVSDHGTNTDERVYSQGYNLVHLLASAEGGGHHVVTKRRLLNDYAIKGFYPLIPLIHTTSDDSFYLRGRSTAYPTALGDFDGNERASIHLRDSSLNVLQILLGELRRKDLAPEVRRAASAEFFKTIDARRPAWQRTLSEIREELVALHSLIERQRAVVAARPKKWTKEDADAGRDADAIREFARLDSWLMDERKYTEFARVLNNLLSLRPDAFNPSSLRDEDLIAEGSMGDSNTIGSLQTYVVGLAPGGLAVAPDGTLDALRSFARVNYFTLLSEARVRNNVQRGVGARPVDFVAVRVATEHLRGADAQEIEADEAVWLHGGPDSQALILARSEAGKLFLRYLPVKNLRQDASGRVSFEREPWRAGLPLKLWEDARLQIPAGETREEWLDGWHTDLEWLRASHLTLYSNAVTGLHEQLARHHLDTLDPDAPGLIDEARLIRRLRLRQRALVESDIHVFANDHWNFDVRGFNPGGNHGSFFRVSTHSTLMFAGGEKTGIPRGLVVEEPYDSLSFLPTVFALTGRLHDGRTPVEAALRQGFRTFPGRLIEEMFAAPRHDSTPVATGAPASGGNP
ncbi:MAG TPA: alkaline phosphatase family protein [Pyrinomonadaceae bacterium]|nr:alkaline phosphatase family protein [Pyrinomonadaceae bacterium]